MCSTNQVENADYPRDARVFGQELQRSQVAPRLCRYDQALLPTHRTTLGRGSAKGKRKHMLLSWVQPCERAQEQGYDAVRD